MKTVLTVKGADDLDIREVNMGNAYIIDLSYYYNVEWMGQELYDAYTAYLQKCNSNQDAYKSNAEVALEIMQEQKKPIKSDVTLAGEKIRKYFPKSYTPMQMEAVILKLLEAWQRKRERDQSR